MKISAQNVLKGKTLKVTKGAVNSEVVAEAEGGATIVSIITNSSVKSLELKKGKEVHVVIKASSVTVAVQQKFQGEEMKFTKFMFALLVLFALTLSACASPTPPVVPIVEEPLTTEDAATEAPAAPANPTLILATTTSTQDSGLLDVLVPMFQEKTGYEVKTIAVGSGEAMKMGEEGNADALLVHAPASEKTFMENGFGKDRFLVMHNDFIIAGPASDPAGIKGLPASDAFETIFNAGAPFITRGDDSGTHKKELALWKGAELDPAGQAWYIETGQGMGASMVVASEKAAYILTDRATYLANKDNYELGILVEGDKNLLNVYHVITVHPEKWPAVNYEGAMAFAQFIIDPAIQKDVIGQFGVEKFGAPLFFPDADKTDADLGLE